MNAYNSHQPLEPNRNSINSHSLDRFNVGRNSRTQSESIVGQQIARKSTAIENEALDLGSGTNAIFGSPLPWAEVDIDMGARSMLDRIDKYKAQTRHLSLNLADAESDAFSPTPLPPQSQRFAAVLNTGVLGQDPVHTRTGVIFGDSAKLNDSVQVNSPILPGALCDYKGASCHPVEQSAHDPTKLKYSIMSMANLESSKNSRDVHPASHDKGMSPVYTKTENPDVLGNFAYDDFSARGVIGPWSTSSALLLGEMLAPHADAEIHSKKQLRERRPKRPLSAYNIFFKEERARILAQIPDKAATLDRGNSAPKEFKDIGHERKKRPHGKISFQSLAKLVGQRWKELSLSEMEAYQSKADQDKQRYLNELQATSTEFR